MVHKALLTSVSSAYISNTGSCNHGTFLLSLLLLRTWLMLELLLVRLMPLLLRG